MGSVACIFTSSCAMSEKKSGEAGSLIGAAAGGVGGYFIGKEHGRTEGDRVKGALIGGLTGAALGQEGGKRSSTLKGLEDVLPFSTQ